MIRKMYTRWRYKCALMLMTICLPPLIQTTTLAGDYQALTYLGLMNTMRLEQADKRQTFENVLCSCVRVQVDGHYGSGSIFKMTEDEIIIVTNRHVLQYWNEDSYVTFFNGAIGNGRVIGMAQQADAGFVSVPIVGFTWDELLSYRNVRPGSDQKNNTKNLTDEPEKEWISIDLATDIWNPQMYEGSIIAASIMLEDFPVEMIYGRGEAMPGMSGGGVFDSYGNYLGMMTGGTLQEEIAALPAETIWEEYKKVADKS